MARKGWVGALWMLCVSSACSDGTTAVMQPTAAEAGGQAGAPATPAAMPQPNPTASGPSASGAAGLASAAAGGTSEPAAVAGTRAAGTGGAGADASQAGRAAPSMPTAPQDAGMREAPAEPEPAMGFDYPSGEVAVASDLVIPAGKTVRIGPGTKLKAGQGVKVQVLGELIVKGASDAPASFDGTGVPRSWHGIVVERGGKLTLEHAHISGATYGLFTMPGSQFSVDSSIIDASFKAAVVQSDGTFMRTRFVATVPETVSLASEVSVDDPNGALTIMDASPTITDCRFDGASTVTDLVRVGGKASPKFDHVYLHDAHCAFHTSGGTNTSAHITNALIENFAYGFMAYTTKPIVENSVFKSNGNDFGICLGATEANAPALKNNFYSSGEVVLDPTCFGIGIADATPASAASPAAGTLTKFSN